MVQGWKQSSPYLRCTAEVTQHLSYILNDGHIVLPAVVPKLRGGKLPLQENGRPFKIKKTEVPESGPA